MNWFSIRNEATSAHVAIHDQIGRDGTSAKNFIDAINRLAVSEIDLHINSPGGSAFDGVAIHNALKWHKARVNITIDGLAASAASVVAMAGDTIRMPENAMMMIHDPHGLCAGSARDMMAMAEALNRVKGSIVSCYMGKAKRPQSEIERLMSAETWFSAKEASEIGFCDEVLLPVHIQNSFDLTQFKHAPRHTMTAAVPQNDLRAQWESDRALREEFGSFDTYEAYMSAVARGLVKVK